MIKEKRGATLVELIISLAVIGILSSSFLGIQLSFAKMNRISRQHLVAGTIAGNLYEIAKGMRLSEFIDWVSKNEIQQDGILFFIEAERIRPERSNELDYLDLVITNDSDNILHCYSMGNSITDNIAFSGVGPLQIHLKGYDSSTKLLLTDGENNTVNHTFHSGKKDKVINIHTYGIIVEQEIIVLIEDQSNINWEVYINEPVYSNGLLKIHTLDYTINSKELWQAYQSDNLLVASRRSDKSKGIPVYLQIRACEENQKKEGSIKYISRRQGIISLITN